MKLRQGSVSGLFACLKLSCPFLFPIGWLLLVRTNHTVIISSKEAQYLSLISDYSAYQTMPESGCAATVYLCQHELGVGQINVCREAFLKKCAGEEKCPIQPQHYYPP